MDQGLQQDAKEFDPQLGSLVSEENQKHLNTTIAIVGAIIVAVVIIVGCYCYSANLVASLMVGGAVGGTCIAIAIGAKLSGESGERTLRVFEHGVTLERAGNLKTMLYCDMEKFEYDCKQIYYNGVYAGDVYQATMTAKSAGDLKAEEMSFRSGTKAVKKVAVLDYSSLMHFAADAVSEKMAAELMDSGKIEWIPGCFIRKDGVEVPVKSGLRSKSQFVPWADFQNQMFLDGLWMLEVDLTGKWRVKLDTSKPNFFPGYRLVTQLVELNSIEKAAVPMEVS